MKKLSLRTCCISKSRFPKEELLRLICKNGEIIIDTQQKELGRGFYISKNKEIISSAKSRKTLNKVFKTNVNDKIYDDLITLI